MKTFHFTVRIWAGSCRSDIRFRPMSWHGSPQHSTAVRARAGDPLPPLWHYGLFLGMTPTALLGEDGHPPRGGFMPPVKLPRRMFAGSALRFEAPLICGEEASKVSEITSVDLRRGKSGDLVFVGVRVAITQGGQTCIQEQQTIVYRSDLRPSAPADLPADRLGHEKAHWLPSTTELFRFSALTFNAHRIRYDLPYAQDKEGYPGLVVHGPLTALRLCAQAEQAVGALKTFSFRAEAPLFAGLPVAFTKAIDGTTCQVAALRWDGVTAMTAMAEF
jgi:3-methylfumaryl-CoA hydratase